MALSRKFASWNINSVRARIDNLLTWLSENKDVDYLFLQELKCQDEQFPLDAIEDAGYRAFVHGQKAYNGVAVIYKDILSPTLISTSFDGFDHEEQSRVIEIEEDGVHMINIYMPNGNGEGEKAISKFDYKMRFMNALYTRTEELFKSEAPFFITGDFNVIPQDEDCYSAAAWIGDALYRPETRDNFRRFLNLGLTDAFRQFNKDAGQYTFWDYQAGRWPKDEGIRIDHFLTSPEITDRLKNCLIDRDARGKEKASDHTPILLEIA